MKLGLGRRAVMVGSLAIGSTPGFVMPFVVQLTMPVAASDLFLLGVGVAIVLGTIIASTYEAAMVANYGRFLVSGLQPSPSEIRIVSKRAMQIAAPSTALMFPILVLTYVQSGESISLGVAVFALTPLAVFPIVAAQSAVYSSYLISSSSFNRLYLSSALRGLPVVIALLFVQNIAVLSFIYSLGEVCRWGVLRRASRRMMFRSHNSLRSCGNHSLAIPTVRSWGVQSLSMAVASGFSLIQRGFLVNSPPGSLSAADGADKIYFAANQAALSGVILPTVAKLPREVSKVRRSGIRRMLLRSLAKVAVPSAVLSIAGLVLIEAAFRIDLIEIPVGITTSLRWGEILLIGVPFMSTNIWGGRVLLLARMAVYLLPISALMVVVGVMSLFALQAALGTVGLVWAAVLTHVVIGVVYAIVVILYGPRRLADVGDVGAASESRLGVSDGS